MTEQHSTQNYEDDFASYLHNPFGFKTEAEQKGIDYFVRKQKIEPSYSMKKNLKHILSYHFGDVKKIHSEGLDKQYKELKQKVNANNLIGLILWGTNSISNEENSIINNYIIHPTKGRKIQKIELSIKNLCRYLIKDYYTYQEVDKLCQIYN